MFIPSLTLWSQVTVAFVFVICRLCEYSRPFALHPKVFENSVAFTYGSKSGSSVQSQCLTDDHERGSRTCQTGYEIYSLLLVSRIVTVYTVFYRVAGVNIRIQTLKVKVLDCHQRALHLAQGEIKSLDWSDTQSDHVLQKLSFSKHSMQWSGWNIVAVITANCLQKKIHWENPNECQALN